MSENSESATRKQTIISYDHKKVIKGIDLSTIYITSLQNIVTKRIQENPDTMLTIGQTFKDFEHIQTEAKKKDEDSSYEVQDMPTLTAWEADLYCLFSLLQSLKWHANKQGLEIEKRPYHFTPSFVCIISMKISSPKVIIVIRRFRDVGTLHIEGTFILF